MKSKLLHLLSFVLFCTITLSFSVSSTKAVEIGDKAPMLKEKMLGVDGNQMSLNDLKKANGLVVVFSCNTCPFVVGSSSFPGWERVYNSTAESAKEMGLGFVLINSNEAKRDGDDSYEAMVQRAKEKGYSMPYVVDENSKLADAFGAKTTPHVYLLDKDMKVVYMGSIDNSYDTKRAKEIAYLQNAMKQLNANEQINEASTPPRGCSIKRK